MYNIVLHIVRVRSKGFSANRENFPSLLCHRHRRAFLSHSTFLSVSSWRDRVTASRSHRHTARVLLTGRHGNLATSLHSVAPKVDGLQAGAPEQTEQESVHARSTAKPDVLALTSFSPTVHSPPISHSFPVDRLFFTRITSAQLLVASIVLVSRLRIIIIVVIIIRIVGRNDALDAGLSR